MRAAVLSVLLLLAATPAAAQLTNLPTLTGRVNDTAGVIDADSARELDRRIHALKDATGDVVIIATVPSIAPYATVEEFAVKLFEKAGIGNRKLDNGILILVAVKEHGIRVEVGYGLEGIVTDGFAGDTIRQLIVPEFKANRYGPGLVAGAGRLMDRIAEGRANPTAPSPPAAGAKGWNSAGVILFLLICSGALGIILYVIYRIAQATGGARSTPLSGGMLGSGFASGDDSSSSSSSSASSSSSDSGSSGFDGGSSGGGGASGSW